MVQTSLMFSGGVQSSFQPIGFVFCYVFVKSLAVKWALSAAMCDCNASVQVWQALLKCIFVWCSIYALLLVVLLYRLAIPHLHDQSSISVCLLKMPGCSGCKHSPSLCALPGVCPANTAHLRPYQYGPGAGVTHAGKCSLAEGVSSTSEKNMRTLGIERILQPQF